VKLCGSVPPNVHDFYHHEHYRTEKKRMKLWESLLREEITGKGNMVHEIDS
jgi:hypothetical protein